MKKSTPEADMRPTFYFDTVCVSNGMQSARIPNVDYAELRSFIIPYGYDLNLVGWIVPHDQRSSGERLELSLDGADFSDVPYGSPRADVAQFFENSLLINCGFEHVIPYRELKMGEHIVRARISGCDGVTSELDVLRLIVNENVANYPIAVTGESGGVTIDDFRTDIGPPCVNSSIYRGCVAIVQGRIRGLEGENMTGNIYGSIDSQLNFEALPVRDDSSGSFLLRFPTLDLKPGKHRIEFVFLSDDGRKCFRDYTWEFEVLRASSFKRPPFFRGKINKTMPAFLEILSKGSSVSEPLFERGELCHFKGWALDLDRQDAMGEIALEIDRKFTVKAEGRQQRLDIAEINNVPEARYCGFVASIDTKDLYPGHHVVRCFAVSKTWECYYPTNAVTSFSVIEKAHG